MTLQTKKEESAQWRIYVARPKRRADGSRGVELSERSGFVMQVSSYRFCNAGTDLYRLQVERIEDVYVIEKKVRIEQTYKPSYGRRGEDRPTFQVNVSTAQEAVTFGPKGMLGMLDQEDKGRGVGRYCLSRVIQWLHDHYPSYRVLPGTLSPMDALTPEERQRRNQLYIGAGFDLTLADDETSGAFSKQHAGELLPHWRRGRVRELVRVR